MLLKKTISAQDEVNTIIYFSDGISSSSSPRLNLADEGAGLEPRPTDFQTESGIAGATNQPATL